MRSFLTTVALCALVLSCDDEHEDSPAECKEISSACHSEGSGDAHDCHENAHEKWSKDECVANRTMCLSVCAAASDGGGQ
jgi:hypothetical protein